ncbi:competence/damage-inducible protein A, partial [[Eubacterium] cellulosolvens]
FWLADQLTRIGVSVERITCTRDDLDEITATLRESMNRRPNLIITTGGLGPTPDDLTMEALARLSRRKMILDKATLKYYSQKRNIPVEDLPKNIRQMARTLQGARCLTNPTGGAPVTIVDIEGTTFIILPGPPREVKAIFTRHLKKMLHAQTGRISVHGKIIVSMHESEVSPLIDQMLRDRSDIYAKPLVKGYRPGVGLPVEIISFGENRTTCLKKLTGVIEDLQILVEEKGRKITFTQGFPPQTR